VKLAENGTPPISVIHPALRDKAVPLEVLDFTQPMPTGTMRSVRTQPASTPLRRGGPGVLRRSAVPEAGTAP